MKIICSVITGLLLAYSAVSIAAEPETKVAEAQPGAALMIFMDVGVVGRRNRAANRMTELHRQHQAEGWTLIDVEPYIEDGDLEGFFISYVGSKEQP